jgi:hypothetical protein
MTGKSLVAAAAAAVALFAVASAQPQATRGAKTPPLLGITEERAPFETLVRLDPKRLRPMRVGRRVDLGFATYTWAFSPDRRSIAFGRKGDNDGVDLDHAESFLRIVDPYGMRITGEIGLGRGLLRCSPAWLAGDRIAAVKYASTGSDSEVVAADPSTRRVVERRAISTLLHVARGGARFVVLSSSTEGISPVQLTVVDARGPIRSVTVDRISGGSVPLGSEDPGVHEVRPGLAVAADGSRAYVIAADGVAAEVDLSSLAVSYRQLALPAVAPAKRELLSLRTARALPSGLVAFTGSEAGPADEQGQTVTRRVSVGLWLIDPSAWTVRRVDRYADSLWLAGGLLLASGWHYHPAEAYATGTGLTGYTFRGERVFRLFAGKGVDIYQQFGARLAAFAEGHRAYSIVDVRKHRIVAERSYKTFPVIVTP